MGKTEQNLTLLLMFILIGWTDGHNITKHYSSKYSIQCDDACDMHDDDYYWCNTKNGWDYCSAKENADYKGKPCRDDHPCRKHGKSYHWCYTEGGSWGYCGLLRNTEDPLLHRSSTYISVCWDECLYNKKGEYFQCHTEEGLDYCSPLPDVTYKNEPCRLDHYCATHGSSYTWCFTESSYDMCGVISDGECKHIIPEPEKKGDERKTVSCKWDDNNSLKEVNFIAKPDLSISAEGSTWKNQIINFITYWRNTYLNTEYSSKIITVNNLRFDINKQVNAEGQQFYNLQIMVNVYTQYWRSPKLAHVVIPAHQELPDRFTKLAFMESFRHRATISVEIAGFSSDI